MHAALRKLGKRGHRGTGGTTITSERFKAHFEKMSGERFDNPREEIEIAVNEVIDIRKEPLAREAKGLLNEEPDEEEIIREMNNVKRSTPGKGLSKNDIYTSRMQGMR